MIQHLLKDTIIRLSSGATAAGTTTVDGGVIDLNNAAGGSDRFAAIASLGDVTATSVLQLSWRESDNSDGSSSTEVSGTPTTAFTAGASDADSKLIVSECGKFTKRYVFPRLTRTTANAVVNSIVVVQHGCHRRPVTQTSDIIASTLVP
jgi:hypothetical protein